MPDPLLALILATGISVIAYFLFRPDRGLVSKWRQTREMSERIRSEDAIKYIHKCEMKGRRPTIESVAGILQLSLNDTAELLSHMQSRSLVKIDGDVIGLTPQGRDSALHIIRAHRLLERYLAEETGYGESEWHGQADRLEHTLSPSEADALSYQLGNPTHDPHGDPIPTAHGDIVSHGGQPLAGLPPDTPAQIVHLEDEPEVVYAQLAAEGLHLGMVVRVIESSPERIRFWANGDEHLLAPLVATNISVRPIPIDIHPQPLDRNHLGRLNLGESAEVKGISAACRGAERRRFMDLGILPGTRITAEMKSPSGDPTAYQIRGALIALRWDQAKFINISQASIET